MKKIRTYNTIATRGLEAFARDRYEVASEITHPNALLLRSHQLTPDEIAPSVIAIARAGAGTNNIPLEQCSERGIVVFNTPGANANAVKELVLAGMLLSTRGIYEGMTYVQGLDANMDHAAFATRLEAEKKRFKGGELAGKTLGVVGLGAIGSMVANMAIALGMKVVGYDPAISIDAAWRLSSEVQKMENLGMLLAHSDFVTLHVPAIDATRHMINRDSLKAARAGMVLLNFARDQIVDEAAVCEALEAEQIARYVTDFPSPGLLRQQRVILMPHIGASTREAEENCAVMAAEELMDYIEHGNIRHSVNFPVAQMPRSTGIRLTFVNENVAGVLGHVLSVLAEADINVIDMLNKSRDELAYNILDLEQAPGEHVLANIAEVAHVIRVRLI